MRILYYICFMSLACLVIYICAEYINADVEVIDLSGLISYTPPRNFPNNHIAFEHKKSVGNVTSTVLVDQSKIEIMGCELDKKAEKGHIAAHKAIVSRSGKTLTISIAGRQIALDNYYKPKTPGGDGDSSEYIYSGVLENTDYHKVEVEYMHDSPWMYLINPVNGSVLLANVGEHTVRHAKDRILLINNSLNPPFGIVLVHLSDLGHEIELVCRSHQNNRSTRIIDEAEGRDDKLYGMLERWQNDPAPGFQLLVNMPKQRAPASKNSLLANSGGVSGSNVVPMEFTLSSGRWHIYVPQSKQSNLSSRLSCWSD